MKRLVFASVMMTLVRVSVFSSINQIPGVDVLPPKPNNGMATAKETKSPTRDTVPAGNKVQVFEILPGQEPMLHTAKDSIRDPQSGLPTGNKVAPKGTVVVIPGPDTNRPVQPAAVAPKAKGIVMPVK